MSNLNNLVSIRVDKSFFDNLFEPARKKLETKFNKKISQSKFTEFIYRSGGQISFPKQKIKRNMQTNWRIKLGL